MKNVIDYIELNKCLEKSKVYDSELQQSFEDLMKYCDELDLYYKTNNSLKIKENIFNIKNNFNNIKYNNYNKIKTIENKIIEYKNTEIIVNKNMINIITK